MGRFAALNRQAPGAKNMTDQFRDFNFSMKSASLVAGTYSGFPISGGINFEACKEANGSHARASMLFLELSAEFMYFGLVLFIILIVLFLVIVANDRLTYRRHVELLVGYTRLPTLYGDLSSR